MEQYEVGCKLVDEESSVGGVAEIAIGSCIDQLVLGADCQSILTTTNEKKKEKKQRVRMKNALLQKERGRPSRRKMS